MTLRLFIALPLPDEIAERLVSLEMDVPGAAWREREHYHLTLRFIGEVDEGPAREIDHELGQIVAAPFEMALASVGSFGGKEPTALWAGVDAPPDLARLAASCETAVRRAGLAAEGRKYKPHVTLAYCHGTSDAEAARFLEAAGEFRTETFWVDHFCMYSSRATRSGSVYIEEAVYPLTGAQRV
jgi:2'-5' RNA ligase